MSSPYLGSTGPELEVQFWALWEMNWCSSGLWEMKDFSMGSMELWGWTDGPDPPVRVRKKVDPDQRSREHRGPISAHCQG